MSAFSNLRLVGVAVTAAASLVIASSGAAYADDPATTDSNVTVSDTTTALAQVPGILSASDTVTTTSDSSSAAIATVDGTTVDVPKDPSAGVNMSADGTTITVTPPNADSSGSGQAVAPGVVAYPSNNGAATAVQTVETGSVRMLTVIANADAPTRYTYPVSVPDGDHLQLADDGGAVIVDASGSYVAGFAPAWAKDAAEQPVPTHYEIDGSSIIQVVDFTAPGVQFPLVADPWFGIKLIDHVSWVNVSNWSPTLAVYPTWWGRYGAGIAARWSAWDEVKKLGGWRANTGSMETQFMCHFDAVRIYAPNKPSWNLDSSRPNASEVTYIQYKCNYPDSTKAW